MKIARFIKDGISRFGTVKGERVVEVDISGDFRETSVSHPLDRVKLLAPCIPSKIVAVGLNYLAHAAELNRPLPEEPMLFIKPSTAVIGPGDAIIYPSHMSQRVDYEGELAVVMNRKAHMVPVEKAKEYILGYTCINDVTARDLQDKDIQFTRSKGFDTFAPLGPWIETDLNPLDVRIQTFLNGEKRQDTSTSDMIFNVFQLVSFISHVMTLLPGDVIATGTPSGIGPMKVGDSVEIRIDGIGGLTNVVKGS